MHKHLSNVHDTFGCTGLQLAYKLAALWHVAYKLWHLFLCKYKYFDAQI